MMITRFSIDKPKICVRLVSELGVSSPKDRGHPQASELDRNFGPRPFFRFDPFYFRFYDFAGIFMWSPRSEREANDLATLFGVESRSDSRR